MKIEILRAPNENDWSRCLFLARITQGKENFIAPSQEWRKKLLASEHSPMRTLMYTIAMWEIPYFVSVHLVRHKFGVEHYVKSQRSNPDRDAERQDSPVNHVMDLNAQALVNMARKRLCTKADPATRKVMAQIQTEIEQIDPLMSGFLIPDCIYRGGCHEFQPCGYYERWNNERSM